MGWGRVYVVDFDSIEDSNLTRSVLFRARDRGRSKAEVAVEALADLNPDTKCTAMHVNVMTEIGLGLVRDVDVVIGCLDNREARLWVNRMCWKTNTPWVDGGIQEINGVAKVFRPPDGACYECAMTENDYRLINLRYSCPLLKQEDILAGKVPTAPTISSIIAGLQTQEALKLIHDMPVADGEALVFNGIANTFYSTRYQHRSDCLSHETYTAPIATGLSTTQNTAKELFAIAKEHLQTDRLRILLDRDLAISLECLPCNEQVKTLRPVQTISIKSANCPNCGETMKPQLEHIVSIDSPLADEKLCDLGVPAYDIVRVETNQQEAFFFLDGDRDQVVGEN